MTQEPEKPDFPEQPQQPEQPASPDPGQAPPPPPPGTEQQNQQQDQQQANTHWGDPYGAQNVPPPGQGQKQTTSIPGEVIWEGPLDNEDKNNATLIHVIGLLSLSIGFPLIGSVITYIIWKDKSPFQRDHAVENLNFHLTVSIAIVIVFIFGLITCGFGLFLIFLPYILIIVFEIMAIIASQNSNIYRYPVNIRIIK